MTGSSPRLYAVRDSEGKFGSGKNTRRFRRIDGLPSHRASPSLFTPRTRILVPPSEPSHPRATPSRPASGRIEPQPHPVVNRILGRNVRPRSTTCTPHSPALRMHMSRDGRLAQGGAVPEYNTTRSHQSLAMDYHAARFAPLAVMAHTAGPWNWTGWCRWTAIGSRPCRPGWMSAARTTKDGSRVIKPQARHSGPGLGLRSRRPPVLVAVRPWPWPRLQAREVTACGICLDPCSSA